MTKKYGCIYGKVQSDYLQNVSYVQVSRFFLAIVLCLKNFK